MQLDAVCQACLVMVVMLIQGPQIDPKLGPRDQGTGPRSKQVAAASMR